MNIEQITPDDLSVTWILFGALLIAIEISAFPGMGFLFGGLGAVTIGGLIAFGFVDDSITFTNQITYFFLSTAFWTAALWMPLKKYSRRRKEVSYDDIIGAIAVVVETSLVKGKKGQVKWSGTLMNARIDKDSTDESIEVDTEVVITGKDGNTLKVRTK